MEQCQTSHLILRMDVPKLRLGHNVMLNAVVL